ncbi:hypothetical protein ACFLU6_03175 [Acidobacteriota bacterium]
MSFFSSKHKGLKLFALLFLIVLGPVTGVVLRPGSSGFMRDMDWTQQYIPVSYLKVVSISPKVLVLYDGFETIMVAAPTRIEGRAIRPGDKISGELEKMPWGYKLTWARAHEHRIGKHLVSLLPVAAVIIWLACNVRRGEGGLSFREAKIENRKAKNEKREARIDA